MTTETSKTRSGHAITVQPIGQVEMKRVAEDVRKRGNPVGTKDTDLAAMMNYNLFLALTAIVDWTKNGEPIDESERKGLLEKSANLVNTVNARAQALYEKEDAENRVDEGNSERSRA